MAEAGYYADDTAKVCISARECHLRSDFTIDNGEDKACISRETCISVAGRLVYDYGRESVCYEDRDACIRAGYFVLDSTCVNAIQCENDGMHTVNVETRVCEETGCKEYYIHLGDP